MKRPALRWLMLWPLLVTVLVGSLAFAVYAENSVRRDLISSLDDELVRVRGAAVARRPPADGVSPPVTEK